MRKGWKRVHRFVVLPDFQGVGIGVNFINTVASIYKDKRVNLATTTPALVHALVKSDRWSLYRYGRADDRLKDYSRYGMQKKHLDNAKSSNRVTYSFDFKG